MLIQEGRVRETSQQRGEGPVAGGRVWGKEWSVEVLGASGDDGGEGGEEDG